MKQVISIFIEKDKRIENIREKYLPNYEKYEPHITIVYPFEFKEKDKLKRHIFESIKDFMPFDISLDILEKSKKGYYIYLCVNKGKKKINELHEKLNGDILSKFRNPDMPKFIAHMSIAILDSEDKQKKVFEEISNMNIKFETKINSIQLLTINEDDSLISKEDFYLS